MNLWIYFWGLVVLFSLFSFTYMSVRILIKGWPELKDMFSLLSEESDSANHSS